MQIHTEYNNTRIFVKKLNKKLIEEEVIITKAGKGNAIVLMDSLLYELKIMAVLQR